MLIDINYLQSKYDLNIRGVLHIGANDGGELKHYLDLGIQDMIFFEPDELMYSILSSKIKECDKKSIKSYNIALGNDDRKIEFNISNNRGQSSSILKPKKHLEIHPEVIFTETKIVDMTKLDNIPFDRNTFNFINMDVQGYELEVLKGSLQTLLCVDYIYTEVNKEYVYENNCLIKELDDFLLKFNFKRVETSWYGNLPWGDAFYIKTNILV